MFEFASTCSTCAQSPSENRPMGFLGNVQYIWASTARNLANSGSPTNRWVPLAKLVYNIWLVVDLPLWKIWMSGGMTIPNVWKKSKPPTRHVYIYIYIWFMADIPIANGGYKATLLSLGTWATFTFHHVPTKIPCPAAVVPCLDDLASNSIKSPFQWNYNMSLTWNKAIWAWFPYTFTMIPGLGRSEVALIYPGHWIPLKII